ncbi:MAG: phosphoribosylamine--glycine ligase, partial [Deltaproteobacteria bacterium]
DDAGGVGVIADGIAGTARCEPVRSDDVAGLVALAEREQPGLVIVGPEAPLVAGLTDALTARSIPTFGPNHACARLEGSKVFAKQFMQRHRIPTAGFRAFDDADAAERYVREANRPLVVKADGLAAGKGVVVADDAGEALAAIDAMMRERVFGEAGARIVIEERLLGEEISFHVITDGMRVLTLGAAQDHKRIGDGDVGPNTGGMGAYAPVPALTAEMLAEITREIVEPTIAGLSADGMAYRGVIFFGIMLHEGRPHALEYNVRFGDPECAVLIERLDGDIVPLLLGGAHGRLPDAVPPLSDDSVIAVVMAAHGYPGTPRVGDAIEGLDAGYAPDSQVLHAGTKREGHRVLTAGGRVLTVTARAATIDEAAERAYARIASIRFDGAQYRRDIAWRARAPR